MSYSHKTIGDIRAEMDRRYAEGTAYADMLPWDAERMKILHGNVLELATYPDGVLSRKLGHTLDVGCGKGGIAAYWPPRGSPDEGGRGDIVGVELSEVAVEQAQKTFVDSTFVASAIEDFQWHHRFDTIVAVESIEHWRDVAKGLDNIRKLIMPDGLFVLTTPNRDSLHAQIGRRLGLQVPFCSDDHVHEFGFDELVALLAAHGFEVVRSLGAFLMPYWALEREFGNKIRQLTDSDPAVVKLLGEAGRNVPHIAFCQCHAARPVKVPE